MLQKRKTYESEHAPGMSVVRCHFIILISLISRSKTRALLCVPVSSGNYDHRHAWKADKERQYVYFIVLYSTVTATRVRAVSWLI